MGVPCVAEVWDTDIALKPVLRKLHRSCGEIHVDPVVGGILCPSCRDFGSADVLVAGPPCPPWSTMGVGNSFDDPRAEVFFKVLDIIVDQARRPRTEERSSAFFMFLIENVEGMLKRSKADRQAGRACPMERVRHYLGGRLPVSWVLLPRRCETSAAGLPHKRGRVYL